MGQMLSEESLALLCHWPGFISTTFMEFLYSYIYNLKHFMNFLEEWLVEFGKGIGLKNDY